MIMTGGLRDGNLKITHVFDKIGAIGGLFSDERLLDILKATKPEYVFVDCPVTEPPCVRCTRPACPGVDACDDLGVAFMQSIVSNNGRGRRRKRPINPQTQRVWDVRRWAADPAHLQEPSYSANMAPLVVRAKTLQRRIHSWRPNMKLRETSVPLSLRQLASQLALPQEWAMGYGSFGIGRKNRSLIFEALHQRKWVQLNHAEEVIASAENFHAFVCGVISCLFFENRVTQASNEFEEDQGWVYLPDLSESQE
ncbi:hypothetical protein [Pseudobacteriovorax antillogorgiicola]|uniref:hypothetical protein n=1 Tax=Pseudobacteriovorax antillogorgiicola TaxID=1513793 RepID=UPI001044A728|nr:hypothetical protein [Pseudobacteriovorax antillogorgiicola]